MEPPAGKFFGPKPVPTGLFLPHLVTSIGLREIIEKAYFYRVKRAFGIVVRDQEVAGSNPVAPTFREMKPFDETRAERPSARRADSAGRPETQTQSRAAGN